MSPAAASLTKIRHTNELLCLLDEQESYTYAGIKDQLLRYDPKALQLNSNGLKKRINYVLRELEKSGHSVIRQNSAVKSQDPHPPEYPQNMGRTLIQGDSIEPPYNGLHALQNSLHVFLELVEPQASYSRGEGNNAHRDKRPRVAEYAEKIYTWSDIHVWEHPVPFLSANQSDLHILYDKIGVPYGRSHPGKPDEGETITSPALEFKYMVAESYAQKATSLRGNKSTVLDISRKIYAQFPSGNQSGDWKQYGIYAQREKIFGIICRELLRASPEMQSVLPVRIFNDYNFPHRSASSHFAAFVTTKSGIQNLIPIALNLIGSEKNPYPWRYEQWNSKVEPQIAPLTEKFQSSPILSCSDAEMIHNISPLRNGKKSQPSNWQARRFQDVWYTKLWLGKHGSELPTRTKIRGRYEYNLSQEWDRYRTVEIIAEKLLRTSMFVSWRSAPPTEPFTLLSLNDFDLRDSPSQLTSPLGTTSVWLRRITDNANLTQSSNIDSGVDVEAVDGQLADDDPDLDRSYIRLDWPVDGKPSCLMLWDCALPPAFGSPYCAFHTKTASMLRQLSYERISPLPNQIHRPINDKWIEQHKLLKTLCANTPDKIWIIDTEFGTPLAFCPVAWEITIRTFTGEVILNTTVDYNSASIDALLAEFRRVSRNEMRPMTEKKFREQHRKFFSGGRTCGMNFQQMRETILKAGFLPSTHKLISYHAGQDMQIFLKILLGNNSPFVGIPSNYLGNGDDGHACIQPVNVHHMVKEMIALPSYTLSSVHSILCKTSSVLSYHHALADVIALTELIKVLVEV